MVGHDELMVIVGEGALGNGEELKEIQDFMCRKKVQDHHLPNQKLVNYGN